MISAFDLILLGGLVSLGGLIFLYRAYRCQPTGSSEVTAPRQRAEAMAGVRWLTVGALALFIGYTRGSDSGYLFDFWSDLAFHTALLSGCWAATVFRIKRVGGKPGLGTTSGAPTGSHSPMRPQGISG
jgi:hypothetical protein